MAQNRAQILITAVDDTRRAFQTIQASLVQLREQAAQVGDSLRDVGAGIGAGAGVRDLQAAAAQYDALQGRLQRAATSQGASRADAPPLDVAGRDQTVLTETAALHARLAAAARNAARSQGEVVSATAGIGQAAAQSARALQPLQAGMARLRTEAGQFGAAFGQMGAALGVGAGVRELTGAADQYKGLQARLKLAVSSQEEFNHAEGELFEMAQRNRAPWAETVSLYTKLAPTLQALGRSQSEALDTTNAVGQAMTLSGSSAEGASAALMQLGQALGSGTLRGDEFNSVMDQAPRLATAIAAGLGVPKDALRQLAEQGKLTSAAVIDALLKQRGRLAEEYGSLPDTVSGALTRLQNAFLRAFGSRDSASGWTAGLAQGIQLLAQHIGGLLTLVGIGLMAAFGRLVSSMVASTAAARAEAIARLSQLRGLEAEAIARMRVTAAALAQARAQGATSVALVTDAVQARKQAGAASAAVAQAAASTGLLGRATAALRGAFTLLGGPIGMVVTAVGLLGSALYSARDAVVEFGGRTASIRQIVAAAWSLLTEKVQAAWGALVELVRINDHTWARLRDTAIGGLTRLGTGLRALVNTGIGAFTAIGSLAARTAEFLVERFKTAFSDIGALTRALKQDIAAAFEGDFSMRAMKGEIDRNLQQMQSVDDELAGKVREAFDRDYVGEAAQAIAARIRPDSKKKDTFAEPPPKGTPPPPPGAAAWQALLKAQADAAFQLLKDSLEREQRALDRALEDRTISIRSYHERKARLEQQEIDAEINRTRQAIAEQQRAVKAAEKPDDRAKAQADLAKINADFTVLLRKRGDVAVAAARATAQAERELREELTKAREELLDLTQASTAQDRRATIEEQYRKLMERLRAEGDSAGMATLGRLIDVKAASADLTTYEREFDTTLARMRASEQSIDLQRQAGLLTESQAKRQILALHRETGTVLDALLPKLETTGAAIGPEAVARVQAWKNEIAQVKLAVDEVAVAIDGSIRDGFGQLFEDIGRGAKTAKEAFGDFARSVLVTIQRIASQKLAESLFASLPKGSGGASGFAGFISSLLKGYASGGYVTGPGTSTSDSIPARLSAGEFVVNAAAVRRVGVAFLHSLNGVAQGPTFKGPALAFAAGGLVPDVQPRQQAPAAQGVRIVNVIDPAMAADYLNSSAGEKTILNILQRNAGSVRQVLT
ncbi:tape measure protein [Eleftheria terrae]|uniref:tape measure protein n=1 Tax=Eleftheria terrae TaxID=1597781 RepID=UPI00263A8E71|nr:tape measure protein [Eleftheria terrae]WKB50775.1 tape measure protein [Eleftheria terrae]